MQQSLVFILQCIVLFYIICVVAKVKNWVQLGMTYEHNFIIMYESTYTYSQI